MTKGILKAGGAALTLAILTVAATAVQSRTAAEAALRAAEGDARSATRALGQHKADSAIRFAEHAVQLRPQDATYRALLGKAYLAAGRFVSARQAFADALQLDAGQSGAALNYALATTATGDFATAQQILDTNAARIAPADRGLAIALAGNPAAGVEVLMAAAREPDANAKTRQNLALALALAGRWPDARQVALADLAPGEVDARIAQWAAFAQPSSAADQVAALLGVTAVADQGQPIALALVSSSTQVAQVEPASVAEPATAPDVPATPLESAAPAPVAAPAAVESAATEPRPAPQFGTVVFGERREVVQRLPVQPIRTASTAAVGAPSRTPVAAQGNYYVQLGAFQGAANARAGWSRARARFAILANRAPSTMPIGKGLVRVSVGGFARNDAAALCRSLKAGGGVCFVRTGAGDQLASWGAKSVQLAAR